MQLRTRSAWRRRFIWSLPSLLVLAGACGGGGGSSTPPQKRDEAALSLEPHTAPLTPDDIRHLLVRTGFGPTPASFAQLNSDGLAAYLDRILAFEPRPAIDSSAAREIEDPEHPRSDELVRWWLHLMTRSPQPLQEVLALFWHDHFATSQAKFETSEKLLFQQHVQLLRRHAAGNLRELLYRIAVDPATLIWLDGVMSEKGKPNENFAREFWELYTLGADNGYTQEDIQEAARAFTGYRLRYDSRARQSFVTWDEGRHDADAKTVFGITGHWGYRELVDLTIDHRPVAEYVATRLFEHFCYADPPAVIVARLAKTLREANYELKPLLRQILHSRAFFSATARANQVKNPVEFVVGFIRSTGLEPSFYDLDEGLFAAGQRPTQPPNVGGWPSGEAWLTAAYMLERGNLVNGVITARDHQNKIGLTLKFLPPPGQRTAANVLDAALGVLRVRLNEAEYGQCLEYLNTDAELVGKDKELVLEPDPFEGSNPQHIDARVRGLLLILAQHPTYHIR